MNLTKCFAVPMDVGASSLPVHVGGNGYKMQTALASSVGVLGYFTAFTESNNGK
jgi:hypothetical protein